MTRLREANNGTCTDCGAAWALAYLHSRLTLCRNCANIRYGTAAPIILSFEGCVDGCGVHRDDCDTTCGHDVRHVNGCV